MQAAELKKQAEEHIAARTYPPAFELLEEAAVRHCLCRLRRCFCLVCSAAFVAQALPLSCVFCCLRGPGTAFAAQALPFLCRCWPRTTRRTTGPSSVC